MNLALKPLSPLPAALSTPETFKGGRRHRIGPYELDNEALNHFNDLLAQIDLGRPPLERDQLASAARELVQTSPTHPPACIRDRMRRAAALDLMHDDPEWQALPDVSAKAAFVLGYLRGQAPLIPSALPVVGHLDDAIMIEAAWHQVAEEVSDYLDYCRLRHIEAMLRGEHRRHFGFTRELWREVSHAEAEWINHCLRVGTSTYVPHDTAGRFRIN